jgi:hypothetical protein
VQSRVQDDYGFKVGGKNSNVELYKKLVGVSEGSVAKDCYRFYYKGRAYFLFNQNQSNL